jgi:co-chaperonin GroES (HSP10)
VEASAYGKIIAVSEEAASAGLRVNDKILYTCHDVSGFKVDGHSYLSLEVQHVGAIVTEG